MSLHIDFMIAILGGEKMEEFNLTGATWFWLLVPMLLTVVLSIISNFTERRE